MKHIQTIVLSVAVVGLLTACPDPGKGKPKAKVEAPKGATSAAAAKKADPAKKAAATGGEKLTLDAAASKLEWVGAKVTVSHPGGFKGFTGAINLVGGKAEGSSVTVDIDMATLFADADKLTGHLKSPDFFNVAKFAKATFASTAIKAGGAGGTHTVTADVAILGVTKSVSFPATIAVTPTDVTAKADFAINRQDWGIKYPGMPDDLIKDNVNIKFEVKANRGGAAPKAAAAAPAAAAPAAAGEPVAVPAKADGK